MLDTQNHPFEYKKQAFKAKIKPDLKFFHIISKQLARSDPGSPVHFLFDPGLFPQWYFLNESGAGLIPFWRTRSLYYLLVDFRLFER